MAEARAPDKEKIKIEYLKGVNPKELSKKYDVSLNTLKSWIKRYGWTKKKKMQGAPTQKQGAPFGNKNAVGHETSVPVENKNAEKHGLFTKWLPEETREIMGELVGVNQLDLLYNNILLQYTAIIRAQKLMYVKDQKDKTTTKIEEKSGNVDGERWEVQQAWDKHATFMTAQSRANTTLNAMVKQYEEMLHKNWDLATEEQKARIAAFRKQAEADKVGPDKDIVVTMEGDTEGWGE